MTFLFYASAILLIVVLASLALVRADAARLAAGMRLAGPVMLGLAGVVLILIGRGGLAGVAFSIALAWYLRGKRNRPVSRTPGHTSTVRTAALEMELDHDNGSLEGVVLAGTFEGRVLGEMTVAELLELRDALSGDGESLQLLETYLDGRSAGWREHADADAGRGQRAAPSSGPMTEQEAYQVLGLEAGASAADIRKAHRRLMQRLHPDLGGSSFLAARINEAKDVLLNTHH